MIPTIVVAGTNSGVGKTSVTLGIVALLARRGYRVQTFKVGPDYLDPTYLALASGRPCYNLDGWMTSEGYVKDLFSRTTTDADVAVVEGVMGLFDGADTSSSEGSTAEIACWLSAPVLLVVNANGMSRSIAAVVHGFTTFTPELRIAGVVANHCGSERHRSWIKDSLQSASLPPLVGALERGTLPELPSRHLGLRTAQPGDEFDRVLEQLAEASERSIDVSKVLALKKTGNSSAHQRSRTPKRVRLGVARDEAFHFYYPDNLEVLEEAGCELVPFSPLHDHSLPADLHGIYIGGGYPEEHAARLSANRSMLSSIREYATDGIVYAECGGLMYLSEGIESLTGEKHHLVGVLPAWTRMCARRRSLGYTEVSLSRDCLFGKRGDRLRGHEFHYSELTSSLAVPIAYEVRRRRSERVMQEGFLQRGVLASYVHLHFASQPNAAARFVKCLEERIPASNTTERRAH